MSDDLGSHDAELSIRARLPALDRFGVAIEWYDSYTNGEPRLHALDVVLLTLVISGRGRHVLGDEERVTVGPCLDVSRLGEPHSLITDTEGMQVVNIYLADDRPPSPRLGDGLDELLELVIPPPAPFIVPAESLRRWDIEDLPKLLCLLRELEEEITAGQPGAAATVEARLTLLLAHCAREVRKSGLVERPLARRGTAHAVDLVRRHIDMSYAADHTLEDLAAMARMERTSFSRAFSKQVGDSVFRYLHRQRIRAAARLLRESDLPISTIAGRVGFHDLSHFQRTFKRLLGVSPRTFRASRR